MFELVKERAVLAHLNTRTELHGDEKVPACDLKLELSLHNSMLNKLHPELRDTFYTAANQADIEADHKAMLRFPLMSAFKWDYEIAFAALTIHGQDLTQPDFTVQGKANKLSLELLEGGSVKLSVRVQLGEIDPDDAAHLFSLLQQTVQISLGASDEQPAPDNFQQALELGQEPHSEARKKADELFVNPVGAQSPEELLGLTPEPAPAV